MRLLEQIGVAAMRQIDPELAHGLAIKALNAGLGPKDGPYSSDRLRTNLAGLICRTLWVLQLDLIRTQRRYMRCLAVVSGF